ncbi:hypothetical protein BGX34_005777 [Mortierella sp. NVP85]|nr:hypothetical protein BGX34_005777 [Mortierella sp. NVP85]
MDVCGLFQVRASRHLVSQLQQQLRLKARSRRRVYGDNTIDQKLSCSPHLIPKRRVSALRKKQAALRLAQDSVQRLPQPSELANQYLEQEQTQGSIPSGRSNGGLVVITTFSGSEKECEERSTSSGSLTLPTAEHPIRMEQHVSHHHQQPMTDGSDKKDVMPRSPASSLSILFSKENELQGGVSPVELMPRSPASSLSILFSKENEIQEAVSPLDTVEVKPRKFLDSSYQFPAKESAYARDTFVRPQRTQHGYHQSLPYNSIKRSSFTVQTSDFHASATFGTLPTATPVLGHDNGASEQSESAEQDSDSSQQEADSTCKFPMGPPRLRRSGSCNNISHRSALSFSSSKKALLSLQERRLSKPEAKLLRLPDIRTSHSRHLSSTHSRQRSRVSPITHYESEALQEAAANLPLPSEQQDPSPPLDSTLNSTFEEPNSMDAGEIKRFVKRSHALQELLTTEESYVNDLDILMHVHLRVLESRSWFPQSLQVKMERCVSGLISLHRDFYYRLEELNMTSESCDRETLYMNLAEAFQIVDRDDLLYSTYCELRMRTIKEIDRSAGQTAMALLRKESKELMAQQGRPSTRADVKDFLIKPIQRICRYPLLLKEILRLTDEDDSEYQYIDQAFQLVKQKAQEIDETQREAERKLLTEQFLKKLPESSLPRKLVSGSQKDQSTFEYNANMGYSYQQGGVPSPGFPSDYGMASSQDGVVPAPFTKAFAGTLGSILLAGALEYVNTSEVPLRLRYYGCFLFDAMLVIVKAKKSNNYEPRQWLPLRLCELQETIQVDGYTRYGWRIVFDQFKIDFGASSAAEQQIWMGNLQERIHIAKAAFARLPREVALFENLVSSLPWRMNRNQASSLMSSRHLQICQTPSASPTPWSVIPSPLIPPPPAAASSTTMTVMSSMVTAEPEKWNARGSVAALDAYISQQDEASEAYGKWPYPTNPPSVSSGEHNETRVGGMTGSGFQEKEVAEQQARNGMDSQMRPDSSFLLGPSTPVSWLISEKHRSHSFDVSKVFTSSTGSIKPNQRSLVQSMFKDVSSENVWTTSVTPQPSPQYASSLSRYGTPPSPKMTVSAPIQIPGLHPDSAIPPANLSLDDEGSTGSVSLTSRLLRRRTSTAGGHSMPNILLGFQERVGFECERRRNSASVGVSTTSFNLRKASEIAHQNNQQQLQRRSSLHDSVIVPGHNGSYENETVVLRPRVQKGEKKTPLRDPVSKLAATGNRFSRWSSGLGNFFDDPESREVPPVPTQDDSAIHDTFHALSNAAELARSRRGNPERPVRRRGTLPSRSLPTLLSVTNPTTESMEASQPADVTVENVEKHWTSIVPNRAVGMNNGGSSDTSGRSRSNSSSDSSQCGPTHTPGEISVSFAPMYPPHAHLQSPMHNERSGLGKGLLRRSSTNGSRSTARTARTAYSASSPLLVPYTVSPRSTANHTRDNSRESLESDLSYLAGSTAVEHGSPPSMGLTPAVSITNWTKETSHAQYERPGPQAYPRPMEVVSGPNKIKQESNKGANMWPQPQQQEQQHQQQQQQQQQPQQQGGEQDRSVDSLPTGYPLERRKSLTILQNISSATQNI